MKIEIRITQLPGENAKDDQAPPEVMERKARVLPESSEGA